LLVTCPREGTVNGIENTFTCEIPYMNSQETGIGNLLARTGPGPLTFIPGMIPWAAFRRSDVDVVSPKNLCYPATCLEGTAPGVPLSGLFRRSLAVMVRDSLRAERDPLEPSECRTPRPRRYHRWPNHGRAEGLRAIDGSADVSAGSGGVLLGGNVDKRRTVQWHGDWGC
jgi:hypothetical protein